MEGVEEATGGTGEEETKVEKEKETEKGMTNWENVVALVRVAFGEGRLAEESI